LWSAKRKPNIGIQEVVRPHLAYQPTKGRFATVAVALACNIGHVILKTLDERLFDMLSQ
jgi:hypothetical protein